MRALVWHGGAELALEELPDPVPADGEVLLDIRMAGICGSDLHAYRGHPGPRRPPLVLGHEAVGTVDGLPGRYVVFPLVVCGTCAACRRGDENLCERRQLLGMHRAGVFAERTAVPRDTLLPVPDAVDDAHAALVEPLAVSVSALRPHALGAGRRVLVIGCGPIGLLTIHVALAQGAAVVAVEPVAERRAVAEALGAPVVLDSVEAVQPETADVAVDAVGVQATWDAAIRGLRPGGELELVGLGQATGPMPIADLVRRAIVVRGHFAYTRDDFATALRMLAERPLASDWVELMPLGAGADAFARLSESPPRATKIMLEANAA
jgi:threonine dehydrogenase-like Zn-dependent dehydrogenase